MSPSDLRRYGVQAQTTSTFGRVLCSARTHHFIIDGPAANGCPGEELTPPEAFLAGIASCGVELVEVLARNQQIPLKSVHVSIEGVLDRGNPVRPDLTVFNQVRLQFQLTGVSEEQGRQLIQAFQGR